MRPDWTDSGWSPTIGVHREAPRIQSVVASRDRQYIAISGNVYKRHGDLVASSRADLWDGTLSAAINYDETGAPVTTGTMNVYTGATVAGAQAPTTGNNCSFWSSSNSGFQAHYGVLTSTSSTWITNSTDTGGIACNNSLRLYCISQ